MHIHRQKQQSDCSMNKTNEAENELLDDKMRRFAKSCFKDCPDFSGLPTLRELFATIFSNYTDRIASWGKNTPLPVIDEAIQNRELFFLRNLEEEHATIQNRTMTLWNLYQETLLIVQKRYPEVDGQSSAESVLLTKRIAQYIHIARTARKATH